MESAQDIALAGILARSTWARVLDEHGNPLLGKGTQQPLLGSVQRFVTPDCDPTINLYDAYWVHRDGMVHSQWPITARGCSWQVPIEI